MKAINAKLITFGLASMLLAACSDSTSDEQGSPQPTILGSEVVSIPASQLTNRVLNFKTVATRAAGATTAEFGDVYSIPAKPSVPSDAIEISPNNQWPSTDPTTATGLTYGKSYVIKKGTKITSGLNLNGATLYVEGELELTGAWGNGNGYNDPNDNWAYKTTPGKLIVLGGKVTLNYNSFNSNGSLFNNQSLSFYNYGGTFVNNNPSNDFFVDSSDAFYTDTALDLGDKTLKVQGKFYAGGNVTVGDIQPLKGGVINIEGDLLGLENKDVEGTVQDETHKGIDGLVNVGGKFACKNFAVGNESKFYACSANISGTLTLTGNGVELHANHIKAGNILHYAGAKMLLVDNSVVECGTYTTTSNGAASVVLQGDNATAVFKANRIQFNGSTTNDIIVFNSTGNGSQILMDCKLYDFKGHEGQPEEDKLDQTFNDITWHGGVDNGVAAFDSGALALNPSACGYTVDPTNPDPTPDPVVPEKILDPIGEVDYDHTHDISATCIQPYDGKMYMSYHTRGKGHGGCIEVFETDAQKQTKMLQYLQDKEKNLDFNHLIVDGKPATPQLYVVGNSFKKGAMMARIDLNADGLLNTTVKDIDENTTVMPLTIVALDKNAKKEDPQDENCIVRDGDKLLVMSTRGYEVFDTELNLIGSKKTAGKAKHIAMGNNTLATLYYDGPVADTIQANGVIEEFATGSDILTATPSKTFTVGKIAPNNGKNTIAIDGNDLYVCRGAEGLTCFDRTTGSPKWTWKAPLTAETKVVQGCANGVTFDSNYIYLACGGYGVVVLDKNTMVDGLPKVVAKKRCTSRNSANYVTLNNGLIYVAYGKSRLQIFQLVDKVKK